MKKEYDFSHGERGRFFSGEATINLPIYLEMDNRDFYEEIAARSNKDISIVVNELLRADRRIIEGAASSQTQPTPQPSASK